jgi:hypothetical protein
MAVLNRSIPATGRGRRVTIPSLGILAAGLVAAAALLPVAQTSNATSTGGEIRRLDAEKADIEARLYSHQAELAGLVSLERIEGRARDIGLVPADRWMYVTVTDPPPAATIPLRDPDQEEGVHAGDDSRPWWKSLLSRLPVP